MVHFVSGIDQLLARILLYPMKSHNNLMNWSCLLFVSSDDEFTTRSNLEQSEQFLSSFSTESHDSYRPEPKGGCNIWFEAFECAYCNPYFTLFHSST